MLHFTFKHHPICFIKESASEREKFTINNLIIYRGNRYLEHFYECGELAFLQFMVPDLRTFNQLAFNKERECKYFKILEIFEM